MKSYYKEWPIYVSQSTKACKDSRKIIKVSVDEIWNILLNIVQYSL